MMLVQSRPRLALLAWAIFVVGAVEGRGHKSKKEEKAHNFESVGRVQQEKHGGFFVDAPGTLSHQGEECQRACRKDLPKSEWKSFTESGGGACPGFCGAAGACCRVGFGLESEACEFGIAGNSLGHVCVRRRVPSKGTPTQGATAKDKRGKLSPDQSSSADRGADAAAVSPVVPQSELKAGALTEGDLAGDSENARAIRRMVRKARASAAGGGADGTSTAPDPAGAASTTTATSGTTAEPAVEVVVAGASLKGASPHKTENHGSGLVWLPSAEPPGGAAAAAAAPEAMLDLSPREQRIRARRSERKSGSQAVEGASSSSTGAPALTAVPARRAIPAELRAHVRAFNDTDHGGRDRMGRWHAQAGQDRTVAKLLRNQKGGFFLDLAANEPVVLSNTRTLERDYGFKGICIEANPVYWRGLSEVRNCAVVGAAVGATKSEVTFRAFKQRGQSRNSGIVGKGLDNGPRGTSETTNWYEFNARTLPLGDILSHLNAPKRLDYFSLDIEGAELMVMKAFPFESYRFSVFSVERPAAELQRLLEAKGYEYLCDHGGFGDQMWVDKEATAGRSHPPLLDVQAVKVEEGPTVPRFSDAAVGAPLDPKGKRCDLGLYTGLYGTQPKKRTRSAVAPSGSASRV